MGGTKRIVVRLGLILAISLSVSLVVDPGAVASLEAICVEAIGILGAGAFVAAFFFFQNSADSAARAIENISKMRLDFGAEELSREGRVDIKERFSRAANSTFGNAKIILVLVVSFVLVAFWSRSDIPLVEWPFGEQWSKPSAVCFLNLLIVLLTIVAAFDIMSVSYAAHELASRRSEPPVGTRADES